MNWNIVFNFQTKSYQIANMSPKKPLKFTKWAISNSKFAFSHKCKARKKQTSEKEILDYSSMLSATKNKCY